MPKLAKSLLIGLAAVGLSALAIQASDIARNFDGAMPGLVSESNNGPCEAGSVLMQLSGGPLCVDQYEASPGVDCAVTSPENNSHTETNMLTTSCSPVSTAGSLPWRFVSLSEAQQLCARANKRLPNNEEWYRISLPLADQSGCNIDTEEVRVAGGVGCATPSGVHDLVGNVWEWVDGSVQSGKYGEVDLPPAGFVSLVDNNGLVLTTTSTPVAIYGDDYAWTTDTGVTGIIRGGFYDGDTDAGIYAQNLSVPFDLRVPGVGFRCVHEPRH